MKICFNRQTQRIVKDWKIDGLKDKVLFDHYSRGSWDQTNEEKISNFKKLKRHYINLFSKGIKIFGRTLWKEGGVFNKLVLR